MRMRTLAVVAGRELRSYFDQATAYILLVVFLSTNAFFFFRTVLVTGEATLRPMFELLPWLFLFFVPAVTMRALAEERSRGTLELVLAQPIREWEFLLGKFLGVLGFLSLALLGTLGLVIGVRLGGALPAGVVVAQYVGALLLAAAFVAVGLWASSLTRNQITAFIVSVTVTFVLMAVSLDLVLIGLPPVLAAVAARLGVLTHFSSIARGVIDLRDVVYFLTLAGVFLSLAFVSLVRGRWNPGGARFRRLSAGTLGILAICVLVNLLGTHIRGRLDLTPGRAYTLSSTTRDVLGDLDDIVTVSFFASKELPPQAELVKRDVEDLLADYRSAGHGQIQLLRYAPGGEDAAARQEAEKLGIPAVQFNVLGQEELQVKQGYLGLAIGYADQVRTVPFIRSTDDLEYRITSAIVEMTNPRPGTVGMVTGHGEPDLAGEFTAFGDAVRESYGIETVSLASDSAEIPDSVGVLVIAGPSDSLTHAEGARLRSFLGRGGSLFLMLQQVRIDETQLFTVEAEHPVLDSLLALYGVAVADGLVYDMRSNGRLTMPSGGGIDVVVPYPLWPVVLPVDDHPTVAGIAGVLTAWTSPLDLSRADSTRTVPLLATSDFGGQLTGAFPISPRQDWNRIATQARRLPVAAALLPAAAVGAEAEATDAAVANGRVVLVGDADFAKNRFMAYEPGNVTFVQNVIDWLTQDESLIGIRAKRREPPALIYPNVAARDLARYGNLLGVPLLFVLFGILRVARRRRLQERGRGEEAA